MLKHNKIRFYIFFILILLYFLKNKIWHYFYGTLFYKLTGKINDKNWTTMNYGYYTKNLGEDIEKYSLNFYDHYGNLYLKDKMDVLEISSGRGGGLRYLSNKWKKTKFLGIDYSDTNVNFSNRNNINNSNLNYIVGDALNLNLNKKYDVIFNIEASHAYGYDIKFYKSVSNLLKKDGKFIYIDFIDRKKFSQLKSNINRIFNILEFKDITLNVYKSLLKTSDYKEKLINKNISYIFRNICNEIYGIKNSYIFNKFENRYNIYFAFVLSKKNDVY